MITRELGSLKYRLYARRSTDTEDKQVQSLDDQVNYMKKLALQDGLTIIGDPICESRSAKRPNNRPLFSALLDEIEAGDIDGIICWKVDRLSRNPTESGTLQQLLQDEKLKHILAMDRSYFPEDNSIVFSVDASQANDYVRRLSVDTKRGMQSKAEKGDKPGVPPLGYLNDRLAKTIVNDPDRYLQVRILWDKMLTGTFSIAQLLRVANEELQLTTPVRGKTGGNPIAYSSLCVLFKNPFYTGSLLYNGTLYKGNHSAMVTQEEFDRVQEIIDPGHTTRPKGTSHQFLLSNLFACGECGFAITAERKVKTLKSTGEHKEYVYYHCTGKSKKINCSQQYMHVSETELISQLDNKLSGLTIDPDFYVLAIESLALEEESVVAKDAARLKVVDTLITKKKQAINNLRRMRYNGEANDDSWYKAEMDELEGALAKLQADRNKSEYKARNWREVADEVFTFARFAKDNFDGDDMDKRRAVVARLGEKLTIMDRTIQFTPSKYLIPIENMNVALANDNKTARTDPDKIKTPTKKQVHLSWLGRPDSNRQPRS